MPSRFRTLLNGFKRITLHWWFGFISFLFFSSTLIALFIFRGNLPERISMQLGGWCIFLLVLIFPGFLLTNLFVSHKRFDLIERLAIALPVGIALFAIPGLVVVSLHLAIDALVIGWITTTLIVILVYLIWHFRNTKKDVGISSPWSTDEIIYVILLIALYIFIFPVLTLPVKDGDLFTFLARVQAAISGQPINLSEPYFGTTVGVNVRNVFNQFTPIWALWSYLSGIKPVDLGSSASRSMIALWVLFAAYFVGKAAGGGNRRIGLYTATIQILIYLISPFFREDNISLFFLERTNTDKFVVAATMLPVVFGLVIEFFRDGNHRMWLVAMICSFAISLIHPLIALMLSIGLAAFGGLHLLLNLRSKIIIKRVSLVAMISVLAILPSVLLLFLAGGNTPFAPTYPTMLNNWHIGRNLKQAMPFIRLPNMDWYGPLPTLAEVEPSTANTDQSPFLIWRYAFNMRRQRLIVFDINNYISDPSVLFEPPYILAVLLLPFLIKGLKKDLGAQFSVSVSLAVIFTMYNPIITPVIGALVVPWILWRFIWLLPHALVIALASKRMIDWLVQKLSKPIKSEAIRNNLATFTPLGLILILLLVFSSNINNTLQLVIDRRYETRVFPTPEHLLERLHTETSQSGAVVVAADQNLSVSIPVYAPKVKIIAHRVFTTSESFPADQQDLALQRLVDQYYLFNTPFLTQRSVEILRRYNVRYVVTHTISNLDFQFRLTPQLFEWLMDEAGYSLYRVIELPQVTQSIQGNSAFVERDWENALAYYQQALQVNPEDMLARLGLVSVYRAQGFLDKSLSMIQEIIAHNPTPAMQYRLGRTLAETGNLQESKAALELAVAGKPLIAIYHKALGDVCVKLSELDCANREYETIVSNLPGETEKLKALANLWRQQAEESYVISLYEQAVQETSSFNNQILLARVYQDAKLYDQGEKILKSLQIQSPLSPDITYRLAQLETSRMKLEQAIDLFHKTIFLQELTIKDSTATHLALAKTLLDANQMDKAEAEVEYVLKVQPYCATAYLLYGDILRLKNLPDQANTAYDKALQLNPIEVAQYSSGQGEIVQQFGIDENLDLIEESAGLYPQELRYLFTLADMMQQLGDVKTAVTTYLLALDLLEEKELSTSFSSGRIARNRSLIYDRLGLAYEELAQISNALDYYRIGVLTSDPRSKLLLADALRRQNQPAEAEAIYREVISSNPEELDASLKLADLLASAGNLTESQLIQQQAIAQFLKNPNQPRGIVARFGNWIINDEQWLDTQTIIGSDDFLGNETDTQTSPESDLAKLIGDFQAEDRLIFINTLAQIYLNQDQKDKAFALYQEEIERAEAGNLPPTELARFYAGIGNFFLNQREAQNALDAYLKAIQLNQASIESYLGMSRAYLLLGGESKSLEMLESARKYSPGSVEVQLALAEQIEQDGEDQRALEIYTKLVQDRPGNLPANLAFARALQRLSRLEEAQAVLKKMIQLMPGDAQAYIDLAKLYRDQTRFSEAEDLLTQAIQIDFTNVEAHLEQGLLFSRLGRYSNAEQSFQDALLIDPSNIDAYIGMAKLRLNQQDLAYQARVSQALSIILEGIEKNPTEAQAYLFLASIEEQNYQLTDARIHYHKAIEIEPHNPNVYTALGQSYQNTGEYPQAIEILQEGLNVAPDNVTFYIEIGKSYTLAGDEKMALEWYQRALDIGKSNPKSLLAFAEHYISLGDFDHALKILTTAEQLFPKEPAVHEALGEYYHKSSKFTDAIQQLETTLDLRPEDVATNLTLSHLYQAIGQWEKSVQVLKNAIKLAPADINAYRDLAQAYTRMGEPSSAENIYLEAINSCTDKSAAYLLRAVYFEAQVDFDKARADYISAYQVNPFSQNAGDQYAHFLNRQGESQAAIEIFQEISALPNNGSNSWTSIGDIQARKADWTAAESSYRQAILIDPGYVNAYQGLAQVFKKLNRLPEAIAILTDATNAAPDNKQAWTALGDMYSEMPNFQTAKTAYLKAIEFDPSDLNLQLKIDELNRRLGESNDVDLVSLIKAVLRAPSTPGFLTIGQIYQQRGEWENAKSWYQKAISLDPFNSSAYIMLGNYYRKLEYWDRALENFENAIRFQPDSGGSYTAYGSALEALGRSEEALQFYQKALALDQTQVLNYVALASLHLKQNQVSQAIETSQKAIEAAPSSYQSYILLGEIYFALGDVQNGLSTFDRGIAAIPGEDALYSARGYELLKIAITEQSIYAIDKLNDIQPHLVREPRQAGTKPIPTKPNETESQSKFRRNTVNLSDAQKQQYLSQAETNFNQALSIRLDNIRALHGLARIAISKNELEKSKSYYESALSLNNTNPLAWIAAGNFYLFTNEPQKAADHYLQALNISPLDASAQLGMLNAFSKGASLDLSNISIILMNNQSALNRLIYILRRAYP